MASQPQQSARHTCYHYRDDSDPIRRKIDAQRRLESAEEDRLGHDLLLLERACDKVGAPRQDRAGGSDLRIPPLLAGSGAMRGPRLNMGYSRGLSRLARVSPTRLEEHALAGYTTAQLARLAGYASHEYTQLRARFLQGPTAATSADSAEAAGGPAQHASRAQAEEQEVQQQPSREQQSSREERRSCEGGPRWGQGKPQASAHRPSSGYASSGRGRSSLHATMGTEMSATPTGSGRVAAASLSNRRRAHPSGHET